MKIYGHMYDSAAGTFPPDSKLNAYYFNGLYAHRPYVTGKGRVWIDVLNNAPDRCRFLDVERGDATPADVPGWLDLRNRVGIGGIYCDLSTLPEVIHHANGREFDLWLATLDDSVPPVTVPHGRLLMVQTIKGYAYDTSVVVDEAFWDEKVS